MQRSDDDRERGRDWLVRVRIMGSDDPRVAAVWETRPTSVEERGDELVAGYAHREAAHDAAAFLGDDAEVVAVGDDWERSWRAHARPTVVDGIAMVPAWCPVPDDVEHTVLIEPGRSFGAGNHPSTRLAVRALQRLVRPGCSILDVGTGTGVLALVAARLGAGSVTAIDIESSSLDVARHNAALNAVTDVVTVDDRSVEDVTGQFDIVVANILPGTLVRLSDDLLDRTSPAGRLVLSGIPEADAERVVAAFQAVEVDRLLLEGWASPVLRPDRP